MFLEELQRRFQELQGKADVRKWLISTASASGQMDDRIRLALEHGGVIDITTTGRKTRRPRRIEIWFHNLDGRLYITGLPGSRDWYANLLAHLEFTFHLKAKARADLSARATPITDETRRRSILSGILDKLGRSGSLEAWVRGSPLVEVRLGSQQIDWDDLYYDWIRALAEFNNKRE
jgi:hypothetical protein